MRVPLIGARKRWDFGVLSTARVDFRLPEETKKEFCCCFIGVIERSMHSVGPMSALSIEPRLQSRTMLEVVGYITSPIKEEFVVLKIIALIFAMKTSCTITYSTT